MDFSPPRPGIKLTDRQRLDWLRLIRSENVGPRTFRNLLNHCGSAHAALDALPGLAQRGGAQRANRICTQAEAEREWEAMQAHGATLIALGEPDYPPLLRGLDDAPPLITVLGRTDVLTQPMVAIVGSRNASAAGTKFAERIVREIGAEGFIIASGLARGIDAAAHRASLATGTVGVLAGGINRIYPPEHKGLAADIAQTGATISEMPWGWEPRARDFPRRNRIISGLSYGVVVIEAARRSGTLITSRLALEQGREVFAVPGSPLDPRAEGTNGLLKQGATLVTDGLDVVNALRPILGRPSALPVRERDEDDDLPLAEPDNSLRARILSLLGPAPVTLDDLIRLSEAPAGAVRVVILEVELAGRLERHGNGMVSLL